MRNGHSAVTNSLTLESSGFLEGSPSRQTKGSEHSADAGANEAPRIPSRISGNPHRRTRPENDGSYWHYSCDSFSRLQE
jgi:hypothetical protein